MKPDDWQKVKEIFHQARELEPEKRAEFLDQVCAENVELREQVEILLESYESGFLEETVLHQVVEAVGGSSLRSGQKIGHYLIKELLGAGGMGEVFLAEDTKLHRPVAFKVLHSEMAADEDRLRRFILEARAASALNHPNILTIHEIGDFESSQFIVSEYVKGNTLREKLKQANLELSESLEIVSQIAAAISAAHEAGIIHRDIKPENIMLRADGLVKVLDFGLAKLSEPPAVAGGLSSENSTLVQVKTNPGVVMGTVAYMSPEQARGVTVDQRTDLWSLGVVLYEMLSGKLPFPGETTSDIIASILKSEAEPCNALNIDLPRELEAICFKALAKGASERYQSAQEFVHDLRQAKKNLENAREETATKQFKYSDEKNTELIRHRPTSSREYIVSQIKRNKRGLLPIFAILLLAAIGFYSYWFYKGNSTPNSEQINSIAVLPFENGTNDADLDFLSDGLSESLIDKLAQLPQLKIIARSSSFKFRGANVDLPDVANKLGVRAIVIGKLIRVGDNLNVRVEMIDVAENRQLWSEQYNRKASDLLLIPQEIAKTASEKLRLKLSGTQEQQLAKRETANSQAYELVLKGRFMLWGMNADNMKKCIEYLEQAVTYDPNYALAHAELATCYSNLGEGGFIDPKVYWPKAEAAARKALELDEDLPEAHAALGSVLWDQWQWNESHSQFRRAVELEPNNAIHHMLLSFTLLILGKNDEAIAEVKRAKELDPLSPIHDFELAHVLFHARRYDESIAVSKKLIETEGNFGGVYFLLSSAYVEKGQFKDAIAAYQLGLEGKNPNQGYLAYVYARSGEQEKAEAILKQNQTAKENGSPTNLAILYAALGDKDAAFTSLKRAFDEGEAGLWVLKVSPVFDPLRDDPRFQDLLRRMKFPE